MFVQYRQFTCKTNELILIITNSGKCAVNFPENTQRSRSEYLYSADYMSRLVNSSASYTISPPIRATETLRFRHTAIKSHLKFISTKLCNLHKDAERSSARKPAPQMSQLLSSSISTAVLCCVQLTSDEAGLWQRCRLNVLATAKKQILKT